MHDEDDEDERHEGLEGEFGHEDDPEDRADFDGDEEDGDEEDEAFTVDAEMHTVCHLCGGVGELAAPVFAVVGGVPRTANASRPCPSCESTGHFPGLLPPF